MAKILIVDDEPDILHVLTGRLKGAGHQVVTAENGKQALEILGKEVPSLIITDVVMPEMDGFQLYKELKQKPAFAKIPVLVLTARGKMEDTFRVIGVDDFVSKPFETETFMGKVNKLLEVSVPQSQAALAVAPTPVKSGAKILLSGSDHGIVAKMTSLLDQAGYAAQVAVIGSEIISKSMTFNPKVILLDLLMVDIATEDMIKILRSTPALAKTTIVVYSFIRSEAGEDVQQKIVSIEAAKENCLAAGATGNIGSFNENTFIKLVSAYLK